MGVENVRFTPKWLPQFKTYQKWMNVLDSRSRKGKISSIMVSNYNSTMKQFLMFLESTKDNITEWTPDLIINWAMKQIQEGTPENITNLLNNFKVWHQGKELDKYDRRILRGNERYSQEYTAHQKSHGVIRGFLSHNNVPMPKPPSRITGSPRVKRNDLNYAVFKLDDDTNRQYADYSQLRLFLSNLSFRDQTIALCVLSSSQDIGDLLSLNTDIVLDQPDRTRIYWEGRRAKTGELFRTFFSTEATYQVRQMLKQRDAQRGESLFIMTGRKRRLVQRAIAQNYKSVAQQLGWDNGDYQNPFRSKRLRSIFNTACFTAKVDAGARHIFMGHESSVNEQYLEMPTTILESIYAQVEPLITVFSKDSSIELAETKKKSAKALEMALEMRMENEKLRQQVNTLVERVLSLESDLKAMEDDELNRRIDQKLAEQQGAMPQALDINALIKRLESGLNTLKEMKQREQS